MKRMWNEPSATKPAITFGLCSQYQWRGLADAGVILFSRMRVKRATILILVLGVVLSGCGKHQPTTESMPPAETNEIDKTVTRAAQEGKRLVSEADVVFRVVTGKGAGEFLRPSGVKGLIVPSEFQTTLHSVQQRKLALILIPAVGYTTNLATNAAARLKECGFHSVQLGVERWGKIFPGPEL